MLEIEIFLPQPDKNKLDFKWSSPYVMDKINPGVIIYSIKLLTNKTTGQKQAVVVGKDFVESANLDESGVDFGVNNSFFMMKPRPPLNKEVPLHAFSSVVSENEWDNPPLLLKLKTADHARPGDYDVTFTSLMVMKSKFLRIMRRHNSILQLGGNGTNFGLKLSLWQ